MKTVAEYDDLKIPTYALSYLVNGDFSGISEEDKMSIDRYMKDFEDIAKENDGHIIFSLNEEDSWFTWNPAFGLACDVTSCTILIVN